MHLRRGLTFFIVFCLLFYITNNYAGVYTQQDKKIIVTADHPDFTIQLQSNPTTGYSWRLEKLPIQYIQLREHSFQPAQSDLVGAPGIEVWAFHVLPTGFQQTKTLILQFQYQRPWEKSTGTPLFFQITLKKIV